ncbi:MAG: repeat-containing protein [Acidobacteria bacterium]|nr:repeat-containing protein [Acidobacteriota bacterium]
MPGFVVCRACGTRIKAGRLHCLRCFEPLPQPHEPVRLPIWESLGLEQSKLWMVGIGASLLVLALVTVIWRTWPEQIDDAPRAVAANARPAGSAPTAVAPSVPVAPDRTEGAAEPAVAADPNTATLTAENRAALEALRATSEQAVAKAPTDTEALNTLGQTLARLNLPGDAIPFFERAIALAPDNARYHANLARAAATLAQGARAVHEYGEVARLLPQDYATRYTFAVALQKNGDNEAALPEFERAIALAPSDASPHRAYAISLEQLQRVPEAIREYRRYLEMRPSAPDADEVKARIQALGSAVP